LLRRGRAASDIRGWDKRAGIAPAPLATLRPWSGMSSFAGSPGCYHARFANLTDGRGKHVNLRIEARAPTRIDLAGGTLDIWPLYLFHPGALTVNCAITRYASCVIETQSMERGIHLLSRDTKRQEAFPSLAAVERERRYRLPFLGALSRF